jgi:hypothetical protein
VSSFAGRRSVSAKTGTHQLNGDALLVQRVGVRGQPTHRFPRCIGLVALGGAPHLVAVGFEALSRLAGPMLFRAAVRAGPARKATTPPPTRDNIGYHA